jgi:hypothetical protein
MRRPRLKFRLRTLIVLVAVAGLLSWGGARIVPWARQMWKLSTDYRDQADFLRSNQGLDLRIAAQLEEKARANSQRTGPEGEVLRMRAEKDLREADYLRRMAPYHASLERLYRRRATHPWEPLPDLPEAPKP